MEREKIVEKIKKLLDHSVENGATQAEAVAFALKAQKLIADNGIEEWELGEEAGREVVEVESRTAMPAAWRKYLLAVVAENFRCRALLAVRLRGSRREQVPTFVGYRQDAEAAVVVYDHLLKTGHRLGKRHEDDYYTDPDAYESFVRGFADGVRIELEKQSQALMLVCPKDVSDYMDGLILRRARGLRQIESSAESREAGRQAGRDAVRSQRMGAGRAALIEG